MAFVEDPSIFLNDFGVPCAANTVNFLGILDAVDEEFNIGGGSVQTRQYKLTYQTSIVTLRRQDSVTVNGVAYTVRNAPNTIDDGAWSEADLSKV